MSDLEKLVGIEEVAEHFSLPQSWFYNRTYRKGSGLPFWKCGKYIRFKISEVMAWLESKQVQAVETVGGINQ